METEEGYMKLLEELKPFPNFFQMGTETTKLNVWKKVEKKLLVDQKDWPSMSEMDSFRDRNLLGFVTYVNGDSDNREAGKSLIDDVLTQSKEKNMNACAMMAIICYIEGEITKSTEIVKKLHELENDPDEKDNATAELCYAWTRIGPKYYTQAIGSLEKLVVKKPKNPSWKFGLALLYRRCLHLSVRVLHPNLKPEICSGRAKYLFEKNVDSTDIEPIYKARSCIELANLYASKEVYPSIKVPNTDIFNLIVKGVKLAPDCASVLMKAGKVMKFIRKYDKSEEYLQRAYELRPNSFVCHQLALAQKSRIIHANKKKKSTHQANSDKNYRAIDYSAQYNRDQNNTVIIKRSGQGSMKWGDDSDKINSKGSTPTQTSKKTVAKRLFEDLSKTLQTDQQSGKSCFNDTDLEEDHVSVSNVPLLEEQVITDVKKLDLDKRPNKTTATVKTFDKGISTTSSLEDINSCQPKGLAMKESQQNYTPSYTLLNCPQISSEKSTNYKLSKAPVFVPFQVEKKYVQTSFGSCKPISMKIITKSPKFKDLNHVSQELIPCLKLFKDAVDYSEKTNFPAYYDWGLTLLQTGKYQEAIEKFNYVIQNDMSKNMRFKSYEQAGICRLKMSENKDEKNWETHQKDAIEMFKKAIRCWADCQRMNIHEYFDDAEENCNSVFSIRQIILGDTSPQNTQQMKDFAGICYMIRQYRESMQLYEEVYKKLKECQDETVIQGIIQNCLKLHQYENVLDLLSLFMCSREGQNCEEFNYEVLREMMEYAIEENIHELAKSVINFKKASDNNFSYDVMILFNEDDQTSKELGKCLGSWLGDIGLTTTLNDNNVPPGRYIMEGQSIIINDSQMAICIINDSCHCPTLNHIMSMTLDDFLRDKRSIFSILIDDSKLTVPFQPFKSLQVDASIHQTDQQKKKILKKFCDIYLA